MKNLKLQVKSILINYPKTRNSDIALTIEIWREFYNTGMSINLVQLYDLPREDNIKRIRVQFCEKGFRWAYPTDWKIARARKINEQKWREMLGYPEHRAGEITPVLL